MIFRAVGKQNITDNAYCPITANGWQIGDVAVLER